MNFDHLTQSLEASFCTNDGSRLSSLVSVLVRLPLSNNSMLLSGLCEKGLRTIRDRFDL